MANEDAIIDDPYAALCERLYAALDLNEDDRLVVEHWRAIDEAHRAEIEAWTAAILERARNVAAELSNELSSVLGFDVSVVFDESPL